MRTPGEHRTVQARILENAEAIGSALVSREEAEQRRRFDPDVQPIDRARNRSLFFDDLLDAKVREFDAGCAEVEGALLGQFRHLHTDIAVVVRFFEMALRLRMPRRGLTPSGTGISFAIAGNERLSPAA